MFAFDLDGNPIDYVQLFDQNGRPLTIIGADEMDPMMHGYRGQYGMWMPYIDANGLARWNVYPMQVVPDFDNPYSNIPMELRETPTPPFATAPPLSIVPEPDASGVPTPTVAPVPTGTSTPSETPSPAETPVPEGSETPAPEDGSD